MIQSDKTMFEFMASMPEWKNIGDCNCTPPKVSFRNTAYPSLEIRVSKDQVQFQMRKLYTAYDSKTVWVAGKINFEHVYKMHINEDQFK